MPLDRKQLDALADEVLTFIEQREAEQIAYGVYDVTMTGREVIDSFQPISGKPFPYPDRETTMAAALEALAIDLRIIRFNSSPDPAEWLIRSRIAEIVRLLAWLRLRSVRYNNQKPRHRINSGKRLTGDVTFHVAARRIPRRYRQPDQYLSPLSSMPSDRSRAAAILRETIEQYLPKLHEISQFQEDAFKAILDAIELDMSRGVDRGVVVTASTGAGKTYAFFLPVLAKIVLERCLRDRIGVKAICIYPRVALSENQLSDFVEAVFYLNEVLARQGLPQITIGIESSAAVYKSSEFEKTDQGQQEYLAGMRGWSFDAAYGGYLAPFAYCVGTDGETCSEAPQRLLVTPSSPKELRCPICNKRYPFVKFGRDVMRNEPPDLLIATTESLNRRLLSSEYQYLFGTEQFAAPSVVMLDEIHLQTSTAGTQVALLLRRLLARIRLGKQERGDLANLAFVGLSATIARPIEFLAELTGLPVTRIVEVKPLDDQLDVIGAERFIFVRAEDNEDTSVISTLIQTAMCVLHNMPQPPADSALERYRTFGFVQSLDVVGRWLFQMQDAEKQRREQVERRDQQRMLPLDQRPIQDVPLYIYRCPPYNRQLFPNFLGTGRQHNCGCEQGIPSLTCPYFQAGDCWWVLSQRGFARREPLNIKRKSGSDRDKPIETADDLIITTSALEVGYDDEALMCVIQYTAPANVASFVQRKGRGGRKVGTRPIVVTVLSPYKSTDLFLFRNQHLLTDPTFRKLPLNAQNRYLQHIHGFYALFDWLTYRAHTAGQQLEFDSLDAQSFAFLLRQTAESSVLLAFKDYIRRTFDMDAEALTRVLTSDPDGLLLRILGTGLVQQAHPLFTRSERYVKPRDLLRTSLPENLFSDINLPEVQVDYRPDLHITNKRLSAESISLALSETIPGNVTFRGGQSATWVPPLALDSSTSLVPIDTYYTCEEIREQPETVNLPGRALRLVGISVQQMRALNVYRPSAIRPLRFSRDQNSAFWFADPQTGVLQEITDSTNPAQGVVPLAHSTSAHPISAVHITEERRTPTRAYTFERDHRALMSDPVGHALLTRAVLHSDEPANMNLLKVQRIILGSQYTLKFHESQEEEIRGVVGFCKNHQSDSNVALGFQMDTEGLVLDLNPHALTTFQPSSQLMRRLRTSAVRHRFITVLTVEHSESYFAAENLADVLLTVVDRRLQAEGGEINDLRPWLSMDGTEASGLITEAIRNIYQLSDRKAHAVYQLLADDRYLTLFLDICADAEPGGRLYRQYLRDTFQYSIAVALRQVAQEVAGVEALNYVAAWTELCADYDDRAADRIWLYEIGMGGIGVMRATHDLLRRTPDRLWTELAHKMTRCTTAQEEALLRHLLAQPEDWLSLCDTLVAGVLQARSSNERQQGLEGVLASVRRQLGVPVPVDQVKALLRVFIPDYSQPSVGSPLASWRLYQEINNEFLPRCAAILGREPSFTEATALLYQDVVTPPSEGAASQYPELRRLLEFYRDMHRPEPGTLLNSAQYERDVRQSFENAVERRLLMTCRGSCPACLDDRSGEIEAPGLARLLLSRSLLAEWVAHVRGGQTLRFGDRGQRDIEKELGAIFEHGGEVVYMRAPGEHLTALCTAISYLTDAGVDTTLGMLYPLIADVQTIYPDEPDQPPMVELTIRPIA